jgi:hypothetical protein
VLGICTCDSWKWLVAEVVIVSFSNSVIIVCQRNGYYSFTIIIEI